LNAHSKHLTPETLMVLDDVMTSDVTIIDSQFG